jgi:hypothetical protein
MHERDFDFRITDNGRQRLRSRKMLLQVSLSFVLLFSLILPVSVTEANDTSYHDALYTTAEGVLCQRGLPDTVTAGEEFVVNVTFAAPADRFHAIGLTDVAPAGWDVSVDVAWTAPQAMVAHTPEPEMAAYIWAGPYAAGVEFTAVYKIKVPVDAEPGTYTFSGSLKYYVEPHPAPSYGEAITGDIQVDVVQVDMVEIPEATIVRIVGVTKEVGGAILPGAAVILYQNGEEIANVVSDENGNYEFEFSELGDYEVVVSKAGFRDETQSISITELATCNLDFAGDHGLIPEVRIVGVTKEVGGAILPGAAVILYQNGEEIANVVSDENGNYEFEFSELGDYDVMVSKAGFRDEAQPISVTTLATCNLDFAGDHGLIPDAPSKSYILACTGSWKFDEPSFQLSTSRLLELISAWKYPYL